EVERQLEEAHDDEEDEDPEEDQVEGVRGLEGGLDAGVPEDRVRVKGVARAEDAGRPGLVQRVDRVRQRAAPCLALRDREVERVAETLREVEHEGDEPAQRADEAERALPEPRPPAAEEVPEQRDEEEDAD